MPELTPNPVEFIHFDRHTAMARMGGNEERFAELAHFFLNYWHDLVNPILDAFEHENWPTIEKAAHKMKGSLAMIGATIACQHATDLEDAARRADLPATTQKLSLLKSALLELDGEIRGYLRNIHS